MILVADSSALITLAIVDQLHILKSLFEKIYIPKAVCDEITVKYKTEAIRLQNFCDGKVKVVNQNFVFPVSLGSGETEAMTLYKELHADFLLCDDKKARKYAESFSIHTVGSLGILLKAKEKGLIDTISPLLDILRKSDIFINEKLYKTVLKLAKE